MPRLKSFDGVELSYDVAGEGPPVVLLHGFAADSERNWSRPGVVSALASAGRQVITLDARGHGHSDKPHEPAAYADSAMVHDVENLLDHLGLDCVDVCGYSMGSMTALAVAAGDGRARSLVMGGAGGRFGRRRSERAARIAEALLADDGGAKADPTARAFRAFADSTGADRHALAAIQQAVTPMGADPSRVAVPTLVITGADDALVGSPHDLAGRFPSAEVMVVAGNHLTAVSDPAFRQGIVDFLARVDARRREGR
jgi:pimeloyl-ACP methyl ester carboxylesterase